MNYSFKVLDGEEGGGRQAETDDDLNDRDQG